MSGSLLLFLSVAVLVGVASITFVMLRSRREKRHAGPRPSAGQRLAVLARQRPDYQMMVGVPPREPASWAIVSHRIMCE